MSKFTDLTIDERIRYVAKYKDLLCLHDVIAKHLCITTSESILRYKLEGNFIKNTLEIRGDYTAMFELIKELQRYLSKEELSASSQDYIRLDLYVFIQKIM